MERQKKYRKNLFNTAINLASDFGFSATRVRYTEGVLEFDVDSNCELARFFELALTNELRSSLQPE